MIIDVVNITGSSYVFTQVCMNRDNRSFIHSFMHSSRIHLKTLTEKWLMANLTRLCKHKTPLISSRRVTQQCVIEDLNMPSMHITFRRYQECPVIPKHLLQNYWTIVKKCFLATCKSRS